MISGFSFLGLDFEARGLAGAAGVGDLSGCGDAFDDAGEVPL